MLAQQYDKLPQVDAEVDVGGDLENIGDSLHAHRSSPTPSSCCKRFALVGAIAILIGAAIVGVIALKTWPSPSDTGVSSAPTSEDISNDALSENRDSGEDPYLVWTRNSSDEDSVGNLERGSSFNHTNGRHEDWMLAKDRAGWKEYPLSDEALKLSYVPRKNSNCGFRSLRDKLDRGESATIVVYGDSVSWGSSCSSSTWGAETSCSWPNRLQAWFKVQFPTWNLTILNRAQRSFGPDNFLDSSIEIDDSDAYIVGFVVASMDGYRRLLQALGGPKVVLGIARTCNTVYKDCLLHCQGNASRVVSVSTSGRQRLQGEGSDGGESPHYLCQTWWYSQEYADAAAQEFGLSLASYRNLYWRDVDHPLSDVAFFYNGMSHPDTVGHDFISHVVEYALWQEFKYEGPPCTIKREVDQSWAGKPLSVLDPRDDAKSIKPLRVSGWRKFEDRPTKPGWIAESFTNESLVEFEVKVQSSLVVTFLASYESEYPALMQVEGCPEGISLDPRWSIRSSMPKSVRFSGQNSKKDHIWLPCLPSDPKSQADACRIIFRTPTGKFKILGILTC